MVKVSVAKIIKHYYFKLYQYISYGNVLEVTNTQTRYNDVYLSVNGVENTGQYYKNV